MPVLTVHVYSVIAATEPVYSVIAATEPVYPVIAATEPVYPVIAATEPQSYTARARGPPPMINRSCIHVYIFVAFKPFKRGRLRFIRSDCINYILITLK